MWLFASSMCNMVLSAIGKLASGSGAAAATITAVGATARTQALRHAWLVVIGRVRRRGSVRSLGRATMMTATVACGVVMLLMVARVVMVCVVRRGAVVTAVATQVVGRSRTVLARGAGKRVPADDGRRSRCSGATLSRAIGRRRECTGEATKTAEARIGARWRGGPSRGHTGANKRCR